LWFEDVFQAYRTRSHRAGLLIFLWPLFVSYMSRQFGRRRSGDRTSRRPSPPRLFAPPSFFSPILLTDEDFALDCPFWNLDQYRLMIFLILLALSFFQVLLIYSLPELSPFFVANGFPFVTGDLAWHERDPVLFAFSKQSLVTFFFSQSCLLTV